MENVIGEDISKAEKSDLANLLAKLSFFNYCNDKEFGTRWSDKNGCFWDSPRDYLHGSILNFCCYGNPKSADEYLRKVLTVINTNFYDDRWNDIQQATGKDAEQSCFVFYVLYKMELTECGAGSPGWLTKKGKTVLSDLEILKAIDELRT